MSKFIRKVFLQELGKIFLTGLWMGICVAVMLWIAFAFESELGFTGGAIASAFAAGGTTCWGTIWIFENVYELVKVCTN